MSTWENKQAKKLIHCCYPKKANIVKTIKHCVFNILNIMIGNITWHK